MYSSQQYSCINAGDSENIRKMAATSGGYNINNQPNYSQNPHIIIDEPYMRDCLVSPARGDSIESTLAHRPLTYKIQIVLTKVVQ